MFLFKKYLVNTLMTFGVVLWVGALSPEIFIRTGLGCVLDENGEELTADGAEAFMESYLYGDTAAGAPVKIQYKFALSELFR